MLLENPESNPRPIRVLPRDLAEKIAAGEVVERPASVIKELVENSLDAGARDIRVELEEGGRRRILIVDNGHGIPEGDVLTALERHATSKISELDDLWNLSTMGFRGEALPSIAAVSRFTIETRVKCAKGRRVYLEGSRLMRDEKLDSKSPVGTVAHGTAIAVEDLFYNVPARLKFLKSKSGEAAQIRELLERIALCNPAVGFTLVSEGRKSLSLPPAANEAERVAKVLETKPENIEEFGSQFEDITVRGWLDRDSRAPNSRHVFLSVNGRMVRDKLLQQAVLVALRPRMMEGEYPKIYVAVEVPRGDVDVNVHPAKSEVRFRKSRDVFQVVHGALSKLAMAPTKTHYSVSLPESRTETVTETEQVTVNRSQRQSTEPKQQQEPEPKLFENDRVSYKTKDYISIDLGGFTAAFEVPTAISEPKAETETRTETRTETETETETETVFRTPTHSTPGFSKLHYIGQLKNTYLLFQDSDGLVLIDQHAAHERINYEKIKEDFLENGLRPQPLLVSAVVKCKAEDIGLALEHADAFTKLGFEFEAFGDNALLIRAAPEGLAPDRANELFKALLEELRDADAPGELLAADPSRLSAKVERILATSACHSSVRAGQSLSPHEARSLASEMDLTRSSLNCPHGRPASIRLTFGQIEGLFKRG